MQNLYISSLWISPINHKRIKKCHSLKETKILIGFEDKIKQNKKFRSSINFIPLHQPEMNYIFAIFCVCG